MERDYQILARDSSLRELQTHVSTLVVAPTGTGKSHIIASIVKAFFPMRAMVLSYRKEIILQLRDTIEAETGFETGVEMGDHHTHPGLFGHKQVIVSTVQTQISKRGGVRRYVKFPPKEFGLLIIDESHHSVAPSSKEVIDYYRSNPDCRVVGFTATPDRHDAIALGNIFESVAFDYEILDAINDGWLVYPDQRMVHVHGLDISSVHTAKGDLNGSELAAVMEAESNILGVADATLQIAGSKRTIVFTASVAQAEAICNIFNRYRPGCAGWVCGKTPTNERTTLLEQFGDGRIQILCNCDVLTEGYDNPGVEVIVMAAPTKSRAKYAQRVGRCLRPLKGLVENIADKDARKTAIACSTKPAALVLDFVGICGKHKLVNTGDILGGNEYEEEVRARAIKLASESQGKFRMVDLLEEEQKKLAEERLKAEERRIKDRARRANIKASFNYTQRKVDAFNNYDRTPTNGAWDNGRHLTPGQLSFLKHQGVDASRMDYGKAKSELIKARYRMTHAPATLGQAKVLGRFGLNPTLFTKSSASAAIDKIKQHGWRLTHEQRQEIQKQAGDRGGNRPPQRAGETILQTS